MQDYLFDKLKEMPNYDYDNVNKKEDIDNVLLPLLKSFIDFYYVEKVEIHIWVDHCDDINKAKFYSSAKIKHFNKDLLISIENIIDPKCKEDLAFIVDELKRIASEEMTYIVTQY